MFLMVVDIFATSTGHSLLTPSELITMTVATAVSAMSALLANDGTASRSGRDVTTRLRLRQRPRPVSCSVICAHFNDSHDDTAAPAPAAVLAASLLRSSAAILAQPVPRLSTRISSAADLLRQRRVLRAPAARSARDAAGTRSSPAGTAAADPGSAGVRSPDQDRGEGDQAGARGGVHEKPRGPPREQAVRRDRRQERVDGVGPGGRRVPEAGKAQQVGSREGGVEGGRACRVQVRQRRSDLLLLLRRVRRGRGREGCASFRSRPDG